MRGLLALLSNLRYRRSRPVVKPQKHQISPSISKAEHWKEDAVSVASLGIIWIIWTLWIWLDVPDDPDGMAVKIMTLGFGMSGFCISAILVWVINLAAKKLPKPQSIVAVVVSFPVAGVLFILAQTALAASMGPKLLATVLDREVKFQDYAIWMALQAVFFIVPVTVVSGARGYFRREREKLGQAQMVAALREAQMAVLRNQINPHFLFNALNSIQALIPANAEAPRAAVLHLSDIFRASLAADRNQTISLAEELETVSHYVELERLRLDTRLRVEWDCAAEVLPAQIPPFLVQLLVENAVKHGVATRTEGGWILIHAWRADALFHLQVVNSGKLPNATGQGTDDLANVHGVGLKNARARLELLFGPSTTLHLRQTGPDEVTAHVTLPFATELA